MPMVNVYVDDATAARLLKASKATDKAQLDICESLIAEGLLEWEKSQPKTADPFKHAAQDILEN